MKELIDIALIAPTVLFIVILLYLVHGIARSK